ncbi:B3 domain-containing protein At3g06220-like [Nicotiana tomentosiformis]|uniref:B3 domain-containing protein At3g06220-like n=1 Tax=Nicotiana tomentosiformis TaxID=4098 RepID=UPI00051CA3B2|nr:B3 domain-containing protein At3g06220-like [Nicotiana tomentosiformis]XP_009613985.1 B3 domain-containing protein At3g06220-like [Nicotiana tomentosiformis]
MSQRKKVKDKMVTSIEQVTIPDHLPEFFKIYHPQICNPQLRIPPAFLKFFNGDIPANSMLQDLAGRSWKVVVEKNDNDFFFMGGWPDFVRDNNLKFGEFLTFSYVGNSNFYVKIYGINGSLKWDVTAIKEPELHPLDEEIVQEIGTAAPPADQALNGSGDLVVYAPSFDIVIKPSYIRKKRLSNESLVDVDPVPVTISPRENLQTDDNQVDNEDDDHVQNDQYDVVDAPVQGDVVGQQPTTIDALKSSLRRSTGKKIPLFRYPPIEYVLLIDMGESKSFEEAMDSE